MNNPITCQYRRSTEGCSDTCRVGGYSRDICCPNFENVRNFAVDVVNSLDEIEREKSFSLVEFSTNASVKKSLTTAGVVTDFLEDDIDYMGGYTNTAKAIQKCQYSFQHSPPGRQNVILLVTDGVPTRPSGDPFQAAINAADIVKDPNLPNPTYVQPVFINAGGNPPSAITFMNDIASGSVFTIDDFDDLNQDAVTRLKDILC
jgi:hypothetical protein